MQKTVIQCATPQEFLALQKAFNSPVVETFERRKFFQKDRLAVVCGGVGKVKAAASSEWSISKWTPDYVIDFGAAGALATHLQVGDVIIANKIIEHDACIGSSKEILFAPHASVVGPQFEVQIPAMWQKIPLSPLFLTQANVRLTQACLAAGDEDIETMESRKKLYERTGAIVTCWEASATARVCRAHKISFCSFRVVTDVGLGAVNREDFLKEYYSGAEAALPPAAALLKQSLH